MKTVQSRTVRIGTICFTFAALVAIDVTAAFAQSTSRSRYNYEYTTPSDQHHWQERASIDFNT